MRSNNNNPKTPTFFFQIQMQLQKNSGPLWYVDRVRSWLYKPLLRLLYPDESFSNDLVHSAVQYILYKFRILEFA